MNPGPQPDSQIPFIGLTGAVAAGKSVALAALEDLGAATLSADQATHEVLADPAVVELVEQRLGAEAVVDGVVDRDAVARLVFADEQSRSWLESVIWPRVGARIWQWRQEQAHQHPPPRALVVEAPLLFEAGMEGAFDTTLVIAAEHAIRRERAIARGHEGVDQREARQLPAEEKAARADHVVVNDGTLDHLKAKLADFLDEVTPVT